MLLFTPSVATSPDGNYIGVFAYISAPNIGTDVWEFSIRKGMQSSWKNHGHSAILAGGPWLPTVAAPSGYLSVFCVGAGSNLWELHQAGLDWGATNESWAWINHGPGPSSYDGIESVAPIVSTPTGYIGVFCGSGHGTLFERSSTDGGSSWVWTDHGFPPDTHATGGVSSPTAVASPDGSYISVFCHDVQSQIWELPFQNGTPLSWANHGAPANPTIKIPLSATFLPSGHVSVFCTVDDGSLYELSQRGSSDTDWSWTNHGNPAGTGKATGTVAITSPDKKYTGVFVIDSTYRVWELPFRNGWQPWISHGYPSSGAYSYPAPVVTSQGYLGIFVGGANQHLYEMYQLGNDWGESGEGWSGWIDHGTP